MNLTVLFDFDDTLARTHHYIQKHLTPTEAVKEEMAELDRHQHSYILGSDELQNLIRTQILEPKKFLTETDLAVWIDDHFVEFKRHLKDLKSQGIKLGVCTHRGWDPKSKPLSEQWLKKVNLPELLEMGVYLNSQNDPCKLTWGNLNLQGQFIIVDDNPVSHSAITEFEEKVFKDQVLLCEAEQRFDRHVHFDTFKTFERYLELMEQKIGVSHDTVRASGVA